MAFKHDFTKQIFGQLTVIEYSHSDHYGAYWRCQCSCGNTSVVRASRLKNAKSCGCLAKLVGDRSRTHGHTVKKNGIESRPWGTASKEYQAWINMRRRCNDPKIHNYSDYGGRGIAVCKEWMDSFQSFLESMGPAPSCKHTIGRKDNDGDYCPANCHWETWQEQQINRRSSQFLSINGRTMTQSQWSKETGINKSTISKRKKAGWSDEECVSLPQNPKSQSCRTRS